DVRDAALRGEGRHAGRGRRAAPAGAGRTPAAHPAVVRCGGDRRSETILRRTRDRVVRQLSGRNAARRPGGARRRAGSSVVKIRGVAIENTFAEAFGMAAARVVITAANRKWARFAADKFTGLATSVIA